MLKLILKKYSVWSVHFGLTLVKIVSSQDNARTKYMFSMVHLGATGERRQSWEASINTRFKHTTIKIIQSFNKLTTLSSHTQDPVSQATSVNKQIKMKLALRVLEL